MSNQFFTENVSTGAHVTNVNGDYLTNPTYNISTHTTTCTVNVYLIAAADSNFAHVWGAARAGPARRSSVMSMNTSPSDAVAGRAPAAASQDSGIQKVLQDKIEDIMQHMGTFTSDMRRIVSHAWASPGRALGNPRNSAQMVWLARSSAQMALLGSRG
ncbi:hypothetical protein FIBSPDRAFT_868357, partial [Athelia psychrophila]